MVRQAHHKWEGIKGRVTEEIKIQKEKLKIAIQRLKISCCFPNIKF
jgi:hypothetical protein